jgi:hypothetical protein
MKQSEMTSATALMDPRDRVRAELEQELVREACASDRPAEADGVEMHTLLPKPPVQR